MRGGTRFRAHIFMCFLAISLFVLSSCGVYSKVPPINPDDSEWEGPLLDQADMEHVQIVVKPSERTIVLNLKELDADISLLWQYVQENRPELLEKYTLKTSDFGQYILVIKKQEIEQDSELAAQ